MDHGFRDRVASAPASGVIERLESGEPPARVAEALGLAPVDLLAAVARDALGDDGPALVQAAPRRPRLEAALSEAALAGLFPLAPRPSRLALAAGLLQAHDFWDASHRAAQEADDLGGPSSAAYWHGIAHRREPDPGNAAYWFRRVGRHPVFGPLADAAGKVGLDPALAAKLLPRGAWDPFAFIDLCAAARPGQAPLARTLQRAEMVLLLGASIPS